MEGIGLRLENLRDKSGFSKKQISRMLGYSDNVYGQYEREQRAPSLDSLLKLAEIFNTTPNEILLGKKEVEKHYKKFEQLIDIFANSNIKDPYFLHIDKWSVLKNNDLNQLTNHFEWMIKQAKSRA